ncbi:helix-turn-helix domain-containing protein [Streptomyces sp. NPDC005438]|uniref:PucR family transcriptional regulator n=1 Tax=Streptomyces sp. NPDC005438 TaxID=3156880 RepID=UPI0033A97E15
MRHQPVPNSYLDGYPELLAEVSHTGRLPRRDELESLRMLGERAAEEGHGLRELISLYVSATRGLWSSLPGVARSAGAAERGRTGDAVLAVLDAAVNALGEGHERAQRMALRQEEAERREFVDDLLHGRSDLGRLSERAQQFGLRLAQSHQVAVAVGDEDYVDTHPLVRRVERDLAGRFGEAHHAMVATKDGRLVCIAATGDAPLLEAFGKLAERSGPDYQGARRVAVGRDHSGPGGVVRSYEEARGALELAEGLGLEGTHFSAEKLMVFPVLLRDRGAIADLVTTVLGPLTQARGGADPLLETLAVYSESGYVNAEAARRLGISVRTLSYRLERIRTLTGYSPSDSLHRYTLETATMGARLLGWPAREL